MFFMYVGSKSLTTGENVNINYELHYKHNFKCKYVVYIILNIILFWKCPPFRLCYMCLFAVKSLLIFIKKVFTDF